MNKKEYHAIGLMSGTSLDGLDLVYVKFESEESYQFEILANSTHEYSSLWKEKLRNAFHLNTKDLSELDIDYGKYLGTQVNNFIHKNDIQNLDFIASHGHTIFHQPEKGITKQIGDGQIIANTTNSLVICDFRTQDVQLGGQGAPLVPIGDRLLFGNYNACVNLGGFANISFEENNRRIAFDISPVNVVLNHLSRKLKFTYDKDGILSSKGRVNKELIKKLNQIHFYKASPPKSLGIEWVHEWIFPLLKTHDVNVYDQLRTFVEHCAIQIANNISNCDQVLFTGGGVFNRTLMKRIEALSSARLIIPEPKIVNFKEALVFAFLGLLKLENQVNCLSSVTGSSKDHSSGVIFQPN